MQFGFFKAHHKITPRGKKWAWPWAGGAPQNLGFPFNISATTEDSDFKFGMQLGFAKGIIKSHQEKKWAWLWAGELPKILEFPLNIFAMAEDSDFKYGLQFGFSKAHHKIKPRGKSGCGPGLGELPNIWGSPLIFLQ